MMKYYVVIDTNVLVSAALKINSNPGVIIRLVDDGLIIPVLNDKILEEYITVLKRPKFHFAEEQINPLMGMINKKSINISEKPIEILLPDEKDRVFYEVVMESRKTQDTKLVTGNIKHFPEKTFIVTPKELCDIILKDLEKESKWQ